MYVCLFQVLLLNRENQPFENLKVGLPSNICLALAEVFLSVLFFVHFVRGIGVCMPVSSITACGQTQEELQVQ